MENIINHLVESFDWTLILIINLITYFIIKIIDELNGNKVPTTWQKRIILIIVCIVTSVFYNYTTNDSINIIINSCIISPIAWSWIAKPIANKLGIDYKQIK